RRYGSLVEATRADNLHPSGGPMNSPSKTILFTDMEGSTEFASTRGDEMAMALVHTHERIVNDTAAEHGGEVVKSTGDGYLVVFPSPINGVAAALDIRGRFETHNAAHPDEALRVRMGLNAGPVIEDRGDVYGLAVNAAARVAAKARTGQVLVSE